MATRPQKEDFPTNLGNQQWVNGPQSNFGACDETNQNAISTQSIWSIYQEWSQVGDDLLHNDFLPDKWYVNHSKVKLKLFT